MPKVSLPIKFRPYLNPERSGCKACAIGIQHSEFPGGDLRNHSVNPPALNCFKKRDFWPRWRHRYIHVPSRTSKRRTTTNLKTKNNQNCQKIELYGSTTTKELQKKHLSRPVGGVETGSRGGEDSQQGSGWWTRQGGS